METRGISPRRDGDGQTDGAISEPELSVRSRTQEQAPAHAALRLAVDTRSGRKPDNREQWRRARGRPRNR